MILHRALIREVLLTSGAVTAVMFCIFFVIRALGFLSQAAEGIIPIDSIFLLLFLKIISYLDIILPLMLYVAVLMVLGRWSRDNEMTIMAASGVGLSQLLRPAAFLLLVGIVIVGGFSLFIAPMAVRAVGTIEHEFKSRNEIVGVIPGVFLGSRGGKGVYFVESFDEQTQTAQGVFAWGRDAGREGVVLAKTAHRKVDPQTGAMSLELKNGVRYEGSPGETEYRAITFSTYTMRVKERPVGKYAPPLKGYRTFDLWQEKGALKRSEWWWRISKIVVLPVLMLFALALGRVNPRERRLLPLFWALVIYFVYTNMVGIGIAGLRQGGAGALTGLWLLHGLFGLAGAYLFWRRANDRPLLSLPSRKSAG